MSIDVSMTTLQSDLERLNARLFNISDLYNQFAWPHQLWETCLVIMYTANHECPRNLIDKIWQNIVQQERRAMRTQSFAALTASVSRKVEHVAKLTSLSLKVFPIDTVCELLEQFSYDLRTTWVAKLLQHCGVSLSTLYDLYHHLLVSTDDKEVHFSVPLRHIVESGLAAGDALSGKRLPFGIDGIILRLEECPEAKGELAKWEALRRRVQ